MIKYPCKNCLLKMSCTKVCKELLTMNMFGILEQGFCPGCGEKYNHKCSSNMNIGYTTFNNKSVYFIDCNNCIRQFQISIGKAYIVR